MITKKQELQVVELIIKDGGIKDGSFDNFWYTYRSEFNFTWKELVPILNKYYQAGDIDEEFLVSKSLKVKYDVLKKEVEQEEQREKKAADLIDNQAKLVARQRKYFWAPIGISIIAVLVSFFKPAPKYDDTQLKEYVREYVNSTRSEIRDDIGDAQIEVLDIVYGDSTIVNK